MKIVELNRNNSILNQYLAEIRDVNIQGDSLRFRRNIERVGEIMAYEISRDLPYQPLEIQTPLAMATEKRSYHTACHCYYPACRTAAAPGIH